MTPQPGRVWAYNWALFAINDFGFPNRPFNGAFFVSAPDNADQSKSFITKVDFNYSGFRPGAFNFSFNSFGVRNTGNLFTDRQSVQNENLTQAEYPIFLNDPIDIYDTAKIGEADLEGMGRCSLDGFEIQINLNRSMAIDLLIDLDGNDGIYTPNSSDVILSKNYNVSGQDTTVSLFWNGIDGLGNDLNKTLTEDISVRLLAGVGSFHFPVYDVEYLTNGLRVEQVRPKSGKQVSLYYDDSQIEFVSGTNEPQVQLSGCAPPCHRWTEYLSQNTPGYGNRNTIDTWWFSEIIDQKETYSIPPILSCKINGARSICNNDTLRLQVTTFNHPIDNNNLVIDSFSWNGPSIVAGNHSFVSYINASGIYNANVFWSDYFGSPCQTSCQISIDPIPISYSEIDTLINYGDTIIINGSYYSEAGQYQQVLNSRINCDSILDIYIDVIRPELQLSCEIVTPSVICDNELTYLDFQIHGFIDGYPKPQLNSYTWNRNDTFFSNMPNPAVSGTGNYNLTVEYLDYFGEQKQINCASEVILYPASVDTIRVELIQGESVSFGNKELTSEGSYPFINQNQAGCDSIVVIEVIIEKLTIPPNSILYDFNNCQANNYSKLTPSYISEDGCIPPIASYAFREQSEYNLNSCTHGINATNAVCISSFESCIPDFNSDKSMNINLDYIYSGDSPLNIEAISFFERAPLEYNWTNDRSGINNYPELFSLLITVDSDTVYYEDSIQTNRDWNYHYFSLDTISFLKITDSSNISIRLLPYCTAGISSAVSAWDLDDLRIIYNCSNNNSRSIEGTVTDINGNPIKDVELSLISKKTNDEVSRTLTDSLGVFRFTISSELSLDLIISDERDYLKNVSTNDILQIKRHILGLSSFDNVYQLLAADVNMDKEISAADILEVLKLILGINPSFSSETSWTFINSRDINSIDDFHNTARVIELDNQKSTYLNIRAIKLGDVSSLFNTVID